ncbi:MAG: hypothetical protein DHS20C18_05950 [Saprospiraceae bacterium]|nr:MAG: hypothetical protein DHS20C18_05950 [Saprospiraceae bacterium]
MNTLKVTLNLLLFLLLCQVANAQENGGGRISGSLEANGNFFMRDSSIGAFNTPQYENQLYGADAWLNLTYSNWGFDFGLRFDMYNNSYLPDPKNSYTDEGIGRWYVKKQIEKLDISAGYLYDQIGSGIIFRAYEERPLFIDNALLGIRLGYEVLPDWHVKVFSGRQKNRFETYKSVIKGISLDGYLAGGEESKWSIAPGFGIVSRTHSDEVIEQLVSTIATYTLQDQVTPKYNTYAFSVFNTLTAGAFNWYIEGAYKTEEVFFDQFAEKLNFNGETSLGKFVNRPGSVVYTSLSYAGGGFGVTLEGKRTEDFTYRTNPFVVLNRGFINFLPPMTRINTFRLNTRYNAATQELGEQAVQLDVKYSPNRKLSFGANFSNITNLEDDLLYREILGEFTYKHKRLWTLNVGLQVQNYNQDIYEGKPGVPLIETITPFAEFLYKIDRKRAVRFEAQYMNVGDDEKAKAKQDYGDWLFGLAEVTIAPHWTFTVSDMFNISPGKNSPIGENNEKKSIHYPRFDVYYTHKANRFSLSYVKQVEGVVCSGGICRLEPAFSGVKLTVNSSF